MTRYGMVIKTKNCVGCNACTVACKVGHGLGPGVFYSHVKVGETGTYPDAKLTVQPVLCNNCTKAACVDVCPVGATYVRDDGIVDIDAEKCIGCRYCMFACPYDVRTFVRDTGSGYYEEGLTPFEEARYAEHVEGTVEKCNFCADRIDEGQLPLCVQTCPAQARIFGDLEDTDGELYKLLMENDHRVLDKEAGTAPRVFYI